MKSGIYLSNSYSNSTIVPFDIASIAPTVWENGCTSQLDFHRIIIETHAAS